MTWKTCWSCSWTHWVKHGQNWGTSTHACTHEHLMRLDYQGRPRITFNLLNWILKKTFRQHSVTATDRVNFEIDSLLGPWHCCIVTTALGKFQTWIQNNLLQYECEWTKSRPFFAVQTKSAHTIWYDKVTEMFSSKSSLSEEVKVELSPKLKSKSWAEWNSKSSHEQLAMLTV